VSVSTAAAARRFWPAGEAAQADYEVIRAHLLAAGELPASLPAARFARRGLAGLIAWPAEPSFTAELTSARRPAWSPHADPRLDALAAGFAVLLHGGLGAGAARGDAAGGRQSR
jgi:hypothetical protein